MTAVPTESAPEVLTAFDLIRRIGLVKELPMNEDERFVMGFPRMKSVPLHIFPFDDALVSHLASHSIIFKQGVAQGIGKCQLVYVDHSSDPGFLPTDESGVMDGPIEVCVECTLLDDPLRVHFSLNAGILAVFDQEVNFEVCRALLKLVPADFHSMMSEILRSPKHSVVAPLDDVGLRGLQSVHDLARRTFAGITLIERLSEAGFLKFDPPLTVENVNMKERYIALENQAEISTVWRDQLNAFKRSIALLC